MQTFRGPRPVIFGLLAFFDRGDTDMELKQPLTINEQVDRLIVHGMTVESPKDAAEFLSYINY